MASATDPSRAGPGAAGTDDAAAVRYVLPRFHLILNAVIVLVVSFVLTTLLTALLAEHLGAGAWAPVWRVLALAFACGDTSILWGR